MNTNQSKGAFTTCTRDGDTAVLLTVDPIKRAYADGLLSCELFPEMQRDWEYEDNKDRARYTMPYYETRPISAMNQHSITVYRALQYINGLEARGYTELQEAFTRWLVLHKESVCYDTIEALRDDLSDIACYAYGPETLRMEVSKRNIKIKQNGDIVLLDLFFCIRKLAHLRSTPHY